MSKGNSGLLTKHQAKISYSSDSIIGESGGYEVLKEVVVRVKNIGARSGNRVIVEGRLDVDTDEWEEIGIVEGNESKLFHVATWDHIRYRCSYFRGSGTNTLISSAFFNDGLFLIETIQNMNDSLNLKLDIINDSLCGLHEELDTLNRQLELVTDHEEGELK